MSSAVDSMQPCGQPVLLAVIARDLDNHGLAWVEAATSRVRDDPAAVGQAFTSAARELRAHARPDGEDPWSWTTADRVRVLLLFASGADAVNRAAELYRFGDPGERRAVLRSLDALAAEGHEPGEVGRRLIADALRSSDPRLVAAALGPFGAGALDDAALGQAVLKCAFLDLDPGRIAAVQERTTPALVRQLLTLALERVMAGRPVPRGLWALAARYDDEEATALLRAQLSSDVPERRAAAHTAVRDLEAARS